MLARDRDSRQVRHWSAWSAAHGARFVNLFPAFMEKDTRVAYHQLFIPGDVHWNPAGHRLVAQHLLVALAQGR